MHYLVDLAGTTVKNKILLHANILEQQYGVTHVILFETLIIGKPTGQRLEFNAIGGKSWCGLQEPEKWTDLQRKRAPSDRLTPATCMAAQLYQLDVIPTSNGSRFLALKGTWPNSFTHMAVSAHKECVGGYFEASVVVENVKDLSRYFDDFLPRLGVPRKDVSSIKIHIFTKLVSK